MKSKYVLVDAFTREAFAGAQIAVFPNAGRITQEQRQLLARELNLTETVFVDHSSDNRCDARLEIFNPLKKSGFAGHAMMAGCFVMADVGMVRGSDARIECGSQLFDVILGLKNQKVQIGLPVNEHYDEYVPSDSELAQIIGVDESEIGYNEYRPMISGNPDPFLMIPLKNNQALRKAVFSENRWLLSFVAPLARQILLFTGDHPFEGVNFAARLMGKGIARKEDPPIGAAAPAFGLYLSQGKADYHRSSHVQRGDEHSRVSILEVNVDKVGQDVRDIRLGGHVTKMGEGYFDLPDE